MGLIQNSINSMIGSVAVVSKLNVKREQALERANAIQQAQQKQKRKFMDYLGKLETSWGGTIGDLPVNIQKNIAKQYSQKQRKELMDKMDKEKKR